MSIFKSVATKAEPTTENYITNHNHGPSYPGIIITVVLMALLVGWLLVNSGRDLLLAAGFRDPAQVVGRALVGLVGLVVALIVGGVIWTYVEYARDKQHARDKENREIGLKELELRLRLEARETTAQRVVDPKVARQHRLIEAIMVDAYHHIHKRGQYTNTDNRPWARAAAKAYKLTNEREDVGYTMATDARNWLLEHGVISGPSGRETVNLRWYPGIAEVRRELEMPIHFMHQSAQ